MSARSTFGKRPDPSAASARSRQGATRGTSLKEFRIEIPDWKPGPLMICLMMAVFIFCITVWFPMLMDDKERRDKVRAMQAEAATLFNQQLPMARHGMTLFAVKASGLILRLSYRTNSNQNGATYDRSPVTQVICTDTDLLTMMRLGAQYDFAIYGSGEQLIDRFTISGSSCP